VSHPHRPPSLRIAWLYARTIVASFRVTLLGLAIALIFGAFLYMITPHRALDGARPPLTMALYAAWMAFFAQPLFSPPETWYLQLMHAAYPLFGFILVGEGIVRLSLLLLSKQQGEKEWMRVKASTYRDHVILCGIGHLGSRILLQLSSVGVPVVAMEKDPQGRFLADAKATGAPVLVRDMKDDQALIDAGVEYARCIVIATNDDIANLEVALDARRLNPKIKILMRMFDQQIASKIKDAFAIDHAFSSAALAAPIVAAMSHHGNVLAAYPVGGVSYVAAEVPIDHQSALIGKTVAQLEGEYEARVVARKGDSVIAAGDTLVIHVAAERAAALLAAASVTRNR